jgi:hypothetical protein
MRESTKITLLDLRLSVIVEKPMVSFEVLRCANEGHGN